jgi:hypothetical protein
MCILVTESKGAREIMKLLSKLIGNNVPDAKSEDFSSILRGSFIRREKSREQWRCGQCSSMQPANSNQCWVESGTILGDYYQSIKERQKGRRWNGNFTAWCDSCTHKLLSKSGPVDWAEEARTAPIAPSLKIDYEWPETGSPQDDPTSGYNRDGVPYKKSEVSAGKWQWVEDTDAIEREREYRKNRSELVNALVTRALTNEELAEVGRQGSYLLIHSGEPFNQKEVELRLQSMLLVQQTFQLSKHS